MGMNDTPKGERVQIALFGKRNAGKSSVVNAITGQNLAIVSEVKGTTTDPVYKAMELLPLGPVMMVDTPGLDDEGALGQQRIEKTKKVLRQTDIAIIICDLMELAEEETDADSFLQMEKELMEELIARKLPYLLVWNKLDEWENAGRPQEEFAKAMSDCMVSSRTGSGIQELKERIAKLKPEEQEKPIVGDLIETGDLVVLVVPIDKAAPKGRLILPQQQTIRDILENGAISVVTRDTELSETLRSLGRKPKLVITDSQAFGMVSEITPEDVLLTSFSILFARYKGDLETLVRGVRVVATLKDGDRVLIAEGCTHHRQCDDIGTVKIPNWLRKATGKDLIFETSSGTGYPEDLTRYAMIVHCGGCTLNTKEMAYRIETAKEQGVSIVNYGILIAYLKGILARSVEPFPSIGRILKEE